MSGAHVITTSQDYIAQARAPRDKRKVPLGLRKLPDAKALRERQRAIMRLKMGGLSNKAVAEAVGCTPQTVCVTMSSGIAVNAMAKLHEAADLDVVDIQKQLRKMAPDCLRNLEQVLNGTMPVTPELKVKTSQDVLDRIGVSKIQQVHTVNMSGHFTGDDLAEMKRRALSALEVEPLPTSDTSGAERRPLDADGQLEEPTTAEQPMQLGQSADSQGDTDNNDEGGTAR